ncbi:MAG: FAD-dependent oxidoreductase [Planctomycetota bacterium]
MGTVTVVGSGVIGLTCAVVLSEHGHRVRVLARDFAWRTTSAVAAAIWFPYEARPATRVHAWARASFARFADLAERSGTGVRMTTGTVHARPTTIDGWWRAVVPSWEPLAQNALPPGVVSADRLRLPVAEMPVFLQYLVGDLLRRGVRIEQREVLDLEQVPGEIVVNCTGLGARTLVPDTDVHPIRGQVVRVTRTVDEFLIDDDHEDGLTYVIPRSQDCVLGGTAEPGDASLDARPAQTEAILARSRAVCPATADAVVREVAVGLRPGRSTVRLERTTLADGRPLLHCYGHGGAGMTLSWGCATEVASLVAGRDG